MIPLRGWIVPVAAVVLLLVLASCGDDYGSYEQPADPSTETEWHRCMRQSQPIGRSAKCQDYR